MRRLFGTQADGLAVSVRHPVSLFAQDRRSARHRLLVLCCAVLCRAVLCRAVQGCAGLMLPHFQFDFEQGHVRCGGANGTDRRSAMLTEAIPSFVDVGNQENFRPPVLRSASPWAANAATGFARLWLESLPRRCPSTSGHDGRARPTPTRSVALRTDASH